MIIGIVGKANVGKSTFFKALTLSNVEIANYPFATIKPNNGVSYVKLDCVDSFFKVQCNPREGYCVNHKRFVPVSVIDVAGLVPGAHEGKGMGNQFLDDLRQADCLIHVVDLAGSTNERGEPVEVGSHDPAGDVKFLEYELDMWYLQILKKPWEKFMRASLADHLETYKAIAKQFTGLMATEDMIKDMLRRLNLEKKLNEWNNDDLMRFATELRKRTKPMIVAANKCDIAPKENLEKLKAQFPDHLIIPCSADTELALKEAAKHKLIDYIPGESSFTEIGTLNETQKKALDFMKRNVLDTFGSTGVQKIIDSAVFELLHYIAIFPGGLNKLQDQYGRILPDCFLMPPGSTAIDFAFKIHTDIGNNFVRAINVKKRIPVGRDYNLENRDVIEIMTTK